MDKDSAAWVIERWSEAFAQALESLIGERPSVSIRLSDTAAGPSETHLQADALWWEQPLSLQHQPAVWVGVPARAWRQIAMRILQASELEDSTETGLRNTFLEALGQSLGGLASSLSDRLGREARAEAGHEILGPPKAAAAAEVELSWESGRLPAFWVGLGEGLLEALEAGSGKAPPGTSVSQPDGPPRTLDLLMEVELPVAVSFGRAELPLKDVLKLSTGSIVELNRAVDEPVELIVNNCVIARGEVVVVDGNYGVRIRQIISPQERLRTLK